MRYFLENDALKVEIDSFGAEVKSVLNKNEYREYMWYGNKKYWGRTSPVLFPFVGSLKNKEFIWEGRHYPMGQHGFARDYEHALVSQTEDEIWFEFTSSEETLARYPFDFTLNIGYKLTGNALKVMWKVTNPADKTMYFSIGAHPAFLCPIHGEGKKDGYKIHFDGTDEIHHYGNVVSTGMTLDEDITMPLEDGCVTITPGFFDRCTYFIAGGQTKAVSLVDPDGRRYVTVNFDTPIFAIWSPEGKDAPFVCIEPWFGRADADTFSGDLSQREYTQVLDGGEVFETSYEIVYA